MPRINAVVVNHNTSVFTDLMLHTLVRSDDPADLDLHLTVLDNGSSDEWLANLKATVAAHGWSFVQSGFDSSPDVNKHAGALQAYFEQCSRDEWILLLDADVWFSEKYTIRGLAQALESQEDTFACHPMIFSIPEQTVAEGVRRIPGATPHDDRLWVQEFDRKDCTVVRKRRCSPICSLIRFNSVVQKVLLAFGSFRAHIYQVQKACFFDTFALCTEVLATHGYSYCVSENEVCHFVGASSASTSSDKRKSEVCRMLLAELDAGASIEQLRVLCDTVYQTGLRPDI